MFLYGCYSDLSNENGYGGVNPFMPIKGRLPRGEEFILFKRNKWARSDRFPRLKKNKYINSKDDRN